MLGAVVLCGGESRRMGQSKAWLPFGPERMLQRIVRIVREEADAIVVVTAPGQDCPPLPASVQIRRDPIQGRGPLQGLAVGLSALPEPVELVFATATDAPFLRPAWIRRLQELVGTDDVALPFVGGFQHPLAALYRRKLVLPAIETHLGEGRLRLLDLMGSLRTRVIDEDQLRDIDPEFASLRNLNTLQEYDQALTDAGFPATARADARSV